MRGDCGECRTGGNFFYRLPQHGQRIRGPVFGAKGYSDRLAGTGTGGPLAGVAVRSRVWSGVAAWKIGGGLLNKIIGFLKTPSKRPPVFTWGGRVGGVGGGVAPL